MSEVRTELLEVIDQAMKERADPAAQAVFLGWVIEHCPEGFREYRQTDHYRRSKQLLAADITDTFAARIIESQAMCILFCEDVHDPEWVERRNESLAYEIGFVNDKGEAMPTAYKGLSMSEGELRAQIARKEAARDASIAAAQQAQRDQVT